MAAIQVGERVQIVKVGQSDKQLLHKFGTLVMLADDVKCVVALDDGGGATVTIGQLKKIA
jgi:hypothetical protein